MIIELRKLSSLTHFTKNYCAIFRSLEIFMAAHYLNEFRSELNKANRQMSKVIMKSCTQKTTFTNFSNN